MRRSRRDSAGGEIAMMAVITKAMGAFLIIMLLLLPSYVGTRRAADDVQEEVKKAKEKVEQALSSAGTGPLTQEEADKLRKDLKDAKDSLEQAEIKIADLEAKIDQLENENDRLEKEAEEQRRRAYELEEKQKFLVEEPFYVEVSFENCPWIAPGEVDVFLDVDSTQVTTYRYTMLGNRLTLYTRGVRDGDIIRLLFAQHGALQTLPQPCIYTYRSYFRNLAYTSPREMPGGRLTGEIAIIRIEEGGYSFVDLPPNLAADIAAINSNSDLWSGFLAPDKPAQADVTEVSAELKSALDKAAADKKLPATLADMMYDMGRWNRISPGEISKRLADIGKPKPKPKPKAVPAKPAAPDTAPGVVPVPDIPPPPPPPPPPPR